MELQYIGPYKIRSLLGEGSFGKVYEVINEKGVIFAIKTETISQVKPMLPIEYYLLQQLQAYSQPGYAFPNCYQYVQQTHFGYIVMDKLTITLENRINKLMKNDLSKDALLRIMYNTLKIIQHVHELGYVMRDIKPSNFMFKQTLKSDIYDDKIYAIDLGLSKKYINPQGKGHIALKTGKKLIGTPLFCSRRAHEGVQLSRRDDLQSWVFMMVYLVMKLPWEDKSKRKSQEKQQQPEEKYCAKKGNLHVDFIQEVKCQQNLESMLSHTKLPKSLYLIMLQIDLLKFEQKPNYEYLYALMQTGRLPQIQKALLNQHNCSLECLKLQPKKEAQNSIVIKFKIPHKGGKI